VKNNKTRDNERSDQENAAKQRDSDKENNEGSGSTDVLGEQEDQDVIF
jgi:hypothetical protein